MEELLIKQTRLAAAIGVRAVVRGWVRTRRDSKGGFSFLELNDGSCLGNLQVVVPGELPNYQAEVLHLTAGCSVRITGEVVPSAGAGQATELRADSVTVLGGADPEAYPLQKKRHSLEKLREWAHLRPRTNAMGAVMRVRSGICRAIHGFYHDESFLYVHTPIITTSDCEGAGAMFRVSTLDPAAPPRDAQGAIDYAQDFFGRAAYLTVSGQLEAETYACALGRVYTFGPTFRAENSNTSRHLAEFWMVEPEAAFFDLDDDVALAERFLRRIAGEVLAHCDEDLALFREHVDATVVDRLTAVRDRPFERMSYTDAVTLLEKSGEKFDYPVRWGADLQAEHERWLTEKHCKSPVVLTDYPRSLKPFYMRVNDDGRTVRAMDVLVPGVGEIIGGSQREERLDVLLDRMAEQGLDPQAYWWYADLRRFGTVPHAGFGLGLERMVQYATGMANIRDVIPFPRTPGSAEF
jgi:asparaginyl-tRNA synthetase